MTRNNNEGSMGEVTAMEWNSQLAQGRQGLLRCRFSRVVRRHIGDVAAGAAACGSQM
jgi:hypothetical protein